MPKRRSPSLSPSSQTSTSKENKHKKPKHNSCSALTSHQDRVLRLNGAEMRTRMDDEGPHHFFGSAGAGEGMHRHVRRCISKYKVDQGANLRVYYHESRFPKTREAAAQQIERLLTQTPQRADQLDQFFERQDGGVRQSYNQDGTLINHHERLLSRAKVVMTSSRAFAFPSIGGETTYGPPPKLKKRDGNNIPVVILTAPMVQLYHPKLDRPLLWDDDVGVRWDLLVQALTADVQLWFEALHHYATEFEYGTIHCRIPPVGGEALAREHYYIDLYCSQMNNALLDAIYNVLSSKRFSSVLTNKIKWRLEFVHFNCHTSYPKMFHDKLRLAGVQWRFLHNASILRPLSEEEQHHHNGKVMFSVINPTNAYHQPGGDAESRSVETMLGNVTSLRMDQSYHFNAEVLNHERYVPLSWS